MQQLIIDNQATFVAVKTDFETRFGKIKKVTNPRLTWVLDTLARRDVKLSTPYECAEAVRFVTEVNSSPSYILHACQRWLDLTAFRTLQTQGLPESGSETSPHEEKKTMVNEEDYQALLHRVEKLEERLQFMERNAGADGLRPLSSLTIRYMEFLRSRGCDPDVGGVDRDFDVSPLFQVRYAGSHDLIPVPGPRRYDGTGDRATQILSIHVARLAVEHPALCGDLGLTAMSDKGPLLIYRSGRNFIKATFGDTTTLPGGIIGKILDALMVDTDRRVPFHMPFHQFHVRTPPSWVDSHRPYGDFGVKNAKD